nr:zinc finger, CCHC-type [Tanacetum cinerariifolium]
MDEAIQGSCITDKLPPSWKDFKHTLKHKKEELTLVEFGSHMHIEESIRMKNLVSSSVLNNCGYKQVIESNKFVISKHAFMSTSKLNDSILWHVRLGRVHFKRMQDMSKDGLIPALDINTKKWNKKYFVTFIDDASRDAIFTKNIFSSVLRPCQRSLISGIKDIGGLVVLKKATKEMDMKTTFLNGDLDEEVYMNQPQGFIMLDNKNKVCKLIKSLYGLKQTPKQWHQKFDEVVLSSGYLLTQADKCMYSIFDKSGKRVIICLYVDDMLIFDTDQVQVDMTKELLSSRFSMKDMGEADFIHGIRFQVDDDSSMLNAETNEMVIVKKIANDFDNYIDAKWTLHEIKLLKHLDHEILSVLKEFRLEIQFELPSGMVLMKMCGYFLQNTYFNP